MTQPQRSPNKSQGGSIDQDRQPIVLVDMDQIGKDMPALQFRKFSRDIADIMNDLEMRESTQLSNRSMGQSPEKVPLKGIVGTNRMNM